ncbi:hypothetical protein VB773_19735 [Haloarculaceae archaeon H-GB2-1]|nr:hypothetical protein [Haloarculaceae archaeon H-GB1-1]MEA5409586.1 hypothetical protein [Haloarculaceae archaeon H-GB2-1]
MYPHLQTTLPTDALEGYSRDTAQVMTAMTFDTHGQPVDYFKQVFTAFKIAGQLQAQGVTTDVQLLVANDAVMHNHHANPNGRASLEQAASERYRTLGALADQYASDLDVQVAYTSSLHDAAYDRIVDGLGDRLEDDRTLRKLLLHAVPDHRCDPDATARENTAYTRRELAVILRSGADIKVGPARERNYDAAARDSTVRELAPDDPDPVVGAYVTDTYPTNVAPETLAKLRQSGGVLPYKGSGPNHAPDRNRIRLQDDVEAINMKILQAPPQLTQDLAAICSYMSSDSSDSHAREYRDDVDAEELAAALNEHFAQLRPEIDQQSDYDTTGVTIDNTPDKPETTHTS